MRLSSELSGVDQNDAAGLAGLVVPAITRAVTFVATLTRWAGVLR